MNNVFHHYATKRAAAMLALFAILLILVAPLISVSLQRSATDVMVVMHHEMGMPVQKHHSLTHQQPDHHDMAQMPLHAMNNDLPPTSHIDHAEACGYCVLLTHVPGLILLAVLLVFGWLRQRVIRRVVSVEPIWLFTPWSRPHTRAPPRLPAFS